LVMVDRRQGETAGSGEDIGDGVTGDRGKLQGLVKILGVG